MTTAASRKEEALWLLERFVPGAGVNNLCLAFEVDGRLLPSVVQDALTFLVRRHEVLRTVFTGTDSGLSRRVLDAEGVKVVLTESELPEDGQSGDGLDAVLTAYVGAPFAMDGEPLLRAQVFHGARGDVFCVALHHLVFDTISTTTLFMEFAAAYGAFTSGNEPEESLRGVVPAASDPEPTERSLKFWRKQLHDFGTVQPQLWLGSEAGDHPDLVGATVVRSLSAEAVEVVRRLQKDLRAPEAVVLLAAYYLLLARHGAGPDLVVGSPVNSRGPADAAAIGYHVNVVPLRSRVDPAEGFGKLVRTTRSVFLNSISHADVPVDSLLLEVDRAGSWRNTLFQHVFNYVPGVEVPAFDFSGMTARFLTVENGFSKFDLEFFILPSEDGIRIRTAYHTGAFDRAEVELLIERYEALLLAVAEDLDRPVGEVAVWSGRDRAVIAASNRSGHPDAGRAPGVLAAFADRVRTAPEAVAVQDGARAVTYAQVWDAATRTARQLTETGIGSGDVVAVAASRSAELAAAVFGVWLAGAAYLPVEPEHPERRVAYQLEDSGARAVLHAPGVTVPAPPGVTVAAMAAIEDVTGGEAAVGAEEIGADDLAYLIYTSGSTGLPKGTRLTHGNLANLIEHFRDELAATPGESTLWLTTFTFDISALELFLPLVSGGRLVVAPDEARTDGVVLASLMERHRIRTVQATPTTWRLVLEAVGGQLAGRNVLCGGEPLPAALARDLIATGCVLRNVYGPTETTIWSTSGLLDDPALEHVSAGRPIRDTQVFVADPEGRELPLLVPGELCIAGGGVAAGYHGRPELTAERFSEHAELGRFYHTGDRARWLANGTLEVLGRSDRQIKLRGVRIELGELEAVLAGHPDVRACAVVLVGDTGADAVLVAFVESAAGKAVTEALWEYASERLPRSSVPQEFVVLDALPTNTSQKVDYPELTRIAARRRADVPGPGTNAAADHEDALVAELITLWQKVLGRGDITGESNFFTHGGHSLLGVLLVQRIEEMTGAHIRLPDIFSHSTPSAVASFIRSNGAASAKR
ncbi:amino acid adenylation domain-containing protein [Streptomyces sp. NPDC057136]|uniref:non-ribosomal peptide synthetase n=1 Tax=Streptomyces sp. NPDC057136 TaxID=3346029 RepID=UPI00364259D3